MSTAAADHDIYANYYSGGVADYYDPAYRADKRLTDLDFWVSLVKPGLKVLEAGCGTGRVTIPMAHAGAEVDGVDFSREFLSILAAKLEHEPEEIRRRINVQPGDIRGLKLGKAYDLIVYPFRVIQHLHTIEDQLACLRSAREHLAPAGQICFNAFNPNYDLLKELGVEKMEIEWTDASDPSLKVKRYFVRESVDMLNQFFIGYFLYRTFRGEELVREDRSNIKMSWYTYRQIQALLAATGLQIVEEYGSFERTPIAEGNEMIFVCEKH